MPTANIPKHIAIIMDGNGRWAEKRKLKRKIGHFKGISALIQTLKNSLEMGIKMLTVFAFSTENWVRPKNEVSSLVKLIENQIKKNIKILIKKNIKIKIIGSRKNLDHSTNKIFKKVEKKTKNNTKLIFTIAFNYGSREEIIEATKTFAKDVQNGKKRTNELNEKIMEEYLYTKHLPNPDLLIRTSGIKRISNYLLWQIAYTEMVILNTLWPDFDKNELSKAVLDFQSRKRKYGNI